MHTAEKALLILKRFARLFEKPIAKVGVDTHRDVYLTVRGKAGFELTHAECDRVLVLLAECDTCLEDIPDSQLEMLVNQAISE